ACANRLLFWLGAWHKRLYIQKFFLLRRGFFRA
ncbi:MAG: hypothetical protein QOF24_2647, partial [Verrucomicrobiota bacterium]